MEKKNKERVTGSHRFDPNSSEKFRLSRYRIEMFIRCPRCFYLDMRFGIKPPDFYSYTLNLAVDALLKKEFDIYRTSQEPHPLMVERGIDGYPYAHRDFEVWRDNFKGMEYFDRETNFIICGAPDDIWFVRNQGLSIVDYKATSSGRDHNIESDYWTSYKRQVEIYQWLLKKQVLSEPVSPNAYFVLANGRKDVERFDKTLNFTLELFSFRIDDLWVEDAIRKAHACLYKVQLPDSAPGCEYCAYRKKAYEKEFVLE